MQMWKDWDVTGGMSTTAQHLPCHCKYLSFKAPGRCALRLKIALSGGLARSWPVKRALRETMESMRDCQVHVMVAMRLTHMSKAEAVLNNAEALLHVHVQ